MWSDLQSCYTPHKPRTLCNTHLVLITLKFKENGYRWLVSSLHLDCSERGKEYESENRNKTHMEYSRARTKKPSLIADLHTSLPTSGAGSRSSHEGQED